MKVQKIYIPLNFLIDIHIFRNIPNKIIFFVPVTCSTINIQNGDVSYNIIQVNGGYPSGTVAHFSCSSQSTLSGSNSSTCQSAGNSANLNPQEPTCDISNKINIILISLFELVSCLGMWHHYNFSNMPFYVLFGFGSYSLGQFY